MGTANEAYSLMGFTPPLVILLSFTLSLHPAPVSIISLAFFSFPLSFRAGGDTSDLRGKLAPEVNINALKHVSSPLAFSLC